MGSVKDFRPIFFVIGVLLTTVALAMLLPAVADGIAGNPDWRVFLAASPTPPSTTSERPHTL